MRTAITIPPFLRANAALIGSTSLLVALICFSLFYLTPLRFLPVVEPRIHDITPTDFYALYKENPDDYIFIDVRPTSDYAAVHPTGAVNKPLATLYDARHTLPKHGKTIVLICGGMRSSGVGYGYLEHYGFLNLMRVPGGVPAWQAAGLPVITSPATTSGESL